VSSQRFEYLLAAVSQRLNVDPDDILGNERYQQFVTARYCLAWLMRREGMSYPGIARRLNRDHTTIIHAVRRVEGDRTLHALAQQLRAATARRRTGAA